MGGTSFQVFAPNARVVQLELTAFGKEEHVIQMVKNSMDVWEIFTHHAHALRTYRYRIQESSGNWKSRTDPFGRSVIETNGICESIVCRMDAYRWGDSDWMQIRSQSNPLKNPLSIYELSVEHWKKCDGRILTFRKLAHEIVKHQRLIAFTHVELYGVLDHKNEGSWGYQPDHFFAVNRRMGNANDFKYLVDLCHQNGIGVILDWNATHYKHEHHGDTSQSLHYYDGSNHFGAEYSEWGTVFFDFEKEETRRLLLASALYWLEKTHVDGLRLDAVGQMLSRGGHVKWSAVNFLKELNATVHEQYPGVVMIAEETEGFPNVTKRVSEGGLGFDVKIGVHLQSRMRNFFRVPYHERSWDEHHFGKLLANLNETGREERFLLSHSHDDAASGSYHQHGTLHSSMPTQDLWRKFADIRLFHAWNLLTPGGGHMIHMGDEIAQKWAWNGRLCAAEGAVEWHLLNARNKESEWHRKLLHYVGDLNRLYCSKPAFWKHVDWGYKMISHCSQNNVVGFHRLDFEGGRLAVFCNFSTIGYSHYDFPFPNLNDDPELRFVRGAREIFNSDRIQYGGMGNFSNTSLSIIKNEWGIPTHFRFAMPPLSVVVFEELWEQKVVLSKSIPK